MNTRKGISPLISTVVLVSVAIILSIAVGFYVTNVTTSFQKFEKLDVLSIQTKWIPHTDPETVDRWEITAVIRNTGTSSSSVSDVLINGQICEPNNLLPNAGFFGCSLPTIGATLNAGETKTIYIMIGANGGPSSPAQYIVSGSSVMVSLHLATGSEYSKLVFL